MSACPWCEQNFHDAVDGGAGALEVFDVMALVGKALGIEEEA